MLLGLGYSVYIQMILMVPQKFLTQLLCSNNKSMIVVVNKSIIVIHDCYCCFCHLRLC